MLFIRHPPNISAPLSRKNLPENLSPDHILDINGVIAYKFTSSRHEAQFHLPPESGGGFSEAGHNERGV